MTILIIDNFDSFTYNLYQLISALVQEEVLVKRNNELDFESIKSIRPGHIVLSPGPGHPANERDFGICKDVIKHSAELATPVLGVCLGHQGIVQHKDGKVIRAPQPVHGKMSPIRLLEESRLFRGIPSGTKVMRYHSLIADKNSLPGELTVTAELDSEEGLIMAVESKKERLYGVQFHPESVGTPYGQKLLENFITLC